MKTLLIGCLLVFALNANAQFSVAVGGGWNNSTIKEHSTSTGTQSNFSGRGGWQAGLQANFALKHWFIYTGLGISQNSFKQMLVGGGFEYEMYDTTIYHPFYVSVPAGAGYQFKLARVLSLRLYAGIYGSAAIGGKLYQAGVNCGELACFEKAPTDRKIDYGNTVSGSKVDDLEATNYGAQFGLALKALKRYELSAEYMLGLQGIMPQTQGFTPGTNGTKNGSLRTFALSVRYYLVK